MLTEKWAHTSKSDSQNNHSSAMVCGNASQTIPAEEPALFSNLQWNVSTK
jgi:hypothetical protein